MTKYFFIVIFVFSTFYIFAQNNNSPVYPIPNLKSNGHVNTLSGSGYSLTGHEVNSDTVRDIHFLLISEFFNEGDTTLQKIKESRNWLRKNYKDSIFPLRNPMPVIELNKKNAKTTGAPSFFINRNFQGTNDPNWCPNDNSVAISNSGYILSATNSNMTIKNESGKLLKSVSLNALLGNDSELSTVLYDPKVIYDFTYDRFFLVCLDGMDPVNSKMVVAFTTSADPTGSWYYYKFKASDILSGLWIDLPSIGLNNQDLCISGNTFDGSGNPIGNVIYKFKKADLLSKPTNVSYKYWKDLQDDQGNIANTVFPVSYGQAGSYGPDMLFVSTQIYGGNLLQLWKLDDSANSINGKAYITNDYAVNGDANQPGTTNQLDIGDCRTKGAFYIYSAKSKTGIIYFTFSSLTSVSSYNGVVKAKFTMTDSGVTSDAVAFADYTDDLAHPNIASYGTNGADESVVITYEGSSATTYPYFKAIALDSANAAIALVIHDGISFINDYDPNKMLSRWGDYTGICRKFNPLSAPTIWAAGCYGLPDNTGGTWIAELSPSRLAVQEMKSAESDTKVYPNPSSANTNLEFTTDEGSYCTVVLFSIDGRYQQQLFRGPLPDGRHKISLSTQALASGSYILHIVSGNKTIATEKLVVQN